MVVGDLHEAAGPELVKPREPPTWPISRRPSRKAPTTTAVPMPAYCGFELAALKMARLALSTQMSMARRTSVGGAVGGLEDSQRPSSVLMNDVTMPLATSPAL